MSFLFGLDGEGVGELGEANYPARYEYKYKGYTFEVYKAQVAGDSNNRIHGMVAQYRWKDRSKSTLKQTRFVSRSSTKEGIEGIVRAYIDRPRISTSRRPVVNTSTYTYRGFAIERVPSRSRQPSGRRIIGAPKTKAAQALIGKYYGGFAGRNAHPDIDKALESATQVQMTKGAPKSAAAKAAEAAAIQVQLMNGFKNRGKIPANTATGKGWGINPHHQSGGGGAYMQEQRALYNDILLEMQKLQREVPSASASQLKQLVASTQAGRGYGASPATKARAIAIYSAELARRSKTNTPATVITERKAPSVIVAPHQLPAPKSKSTSTDMEAISAALSAAFLSDLVKAGIPASMGVEGAMGLLQKPQKSALGDVVLKVLQSNVGKYLGMAKVPVMDADTKGFFVGMAKKLTEMPLAEMKKELPMNPDALKAKADQSPYYIPLMRVSKKAAKTLIPKVLKAGIDNAELRKAAAERIDLLIKDVFPADVKPAESIAKGGLNKTYLVAGGLAAAGLFMFMNK